MNLRALRALHDAWARGSGARCWSAVGYWVGANEDLWRPLLQKATLWLFGGIAVLVVGYVWYQRRRETDRLRGDGLALAGLAALALAALRLAQRSAARSGAARANARLRPSPCPRRRAPAARSQTSTWSRRARRS